MEPEADLEWLEQLRGVYAPVEPGWWPFAPGWWLLLLVLITLLVLWYLQHRRTRDDLFSSAGKHLDGIQQNYRINNDDQQLLLELSSWLKRVSIAVFPEQHPASLTGERWLLFLDQPVQGRPFSQGIGRVFADAVYAGRTPNHFDAGQLLALCQKWLQSVQDEVSGKRTARAV